MLEIERFLWRAILRVAEGQPPQEAIREFDRQTEDLAADSRDEDELSPHVFESDITAIRTFIREMVAQSIVPHMEHKVSIWNDQIASKRRGFTGRFVSISKRWTGFGIGGGGGGSRNSGIST